MRTTLVLTLVVVCSSAGAATDPRCAQLESLNKQYNGVKLTSEQNRVKAQLVSWYVANCHGKKAKAATN